MNELQHRIISTLRAAPTIDPAAEIERRVEFLCDYVRSAPGVRGFVLGISGGQDSSLAGRLAKLAADRLRAEGRDAEFVGVRLPYSRQIDEDDALLALEFIQPDQSVTINIGETVDALTAAVSEAMGSVTDFTKGNVKARIRMVAQYTIAGDRQLLVVGTDHAAEAITGFFTKYGDGAADVVPLAGLTKSQGALLLRELGAPDRLWEKVPTADLLDDEPGQTDEDSLGLSYEEIDTFLTGGKISTEALSNLAHRFVTSEHKRRLPAGPDDTWWKGSET